MRKVWLLLVLAALWPAASTAAETGHVGTVTSIVDGDTLIVAPPLDGGGEIRLVGIQAPKLPLGRRGFTAWPLAEDAKQTLAELTLGKQVRLSFGGVRRDRYGRWLAHLHVLDGGAPGLWVQGEILRRGMARVYSFPDNRALIGDLLDAERSARSAKRGIWSDPFYHIRNPDPKALAPMIGTFQLIEGRIAKVADVKGTVYFNFGADWRDDFTIAIAARHRKAFDAAGWDFAALQGRPIRVRGWLADRNGPVINATHPEQIELLDR